MVINCQALICLLELTMCNPFECVSNALRKMDFTVSLLFPSARVHLCPQLL